MGAAAAVAPRAPERVMATAVVYGVMVLVAGLPGTAVLVVSWCSRIRPPRASRPPLADGPAHA